jgi:hypothetical protein
MVTELLFAGETEAKAGFILADYGAPEGAP